MKSVVYWIDSTFPGRLALVPRPRGGDWLTDEIEAWRQAGIEAVVSMLEPDENDELDLNDEAGLCRLNSLTFFSVPVRDQGVPQDSELVRRSVVSIRAALLRGQNVAVHCRQSLGRAPIFAALVMVSFGFSTAEAFALIGNARGAVVPETEEQRRWVAEFGRHFAITRATDPVTAVHE